MNWLLLSQALLGGVVRAISTTVLAGFIASPMSWSPEGDWLTYTVAARQDDERLQPGWLFNTDAEPAHRTEAGEAAPAKSGRLPAFYQLWASHRDCRRSVLLAQSRWPLSAPAWSPVGHAVAYGRFLPASIESSQPLERGRYDIVVQDGLERSRVVFTFPSFVMDPQARAEVPHLACAWSPDGAYLAIPRPGRPHAVVFVKTDTGRPLYVAENAILPVWSPDGAQCALIHQVNDDNAIAVVERRGQTFAAARQVVATGRFAAPLHWTPDGRALYAVIERSLARAREPEVAQVFVEGGEPVHLDSLVGDPLRKMATIRSVTIDFDHDLDRCFYAVDVEGRDHSVVWSAPRERLTHKPFHPVDSSQRIGGLAVSPDGRLVAVRFGAPDSLTPPAVFDTETDTTALLVPDGESRKAWITELALVTRRRLLAALPAGGADGGVGARPTILPLPGEIAADGLGLRVRRLARFGAALFPQRPQHDDEANLDGQAEIEARLAFDYLEGDCSGAVEALARLESLITRPAERFNLLSVRAQILWSRGDMLEARGVIDYLLSATGSRTHQVEETPLGLAVTPYVSPNHAWARYMAKKAAETSRPTAGPGVESDFDASEPILQNPFAAPDPPAPERGAAGPGALGRDLDRLFGPQP